MFKLWANKIINIYTFTTKQVEDNGEVLRKTFQDTWNEGLKPVGTKVVMNVAKDPWKFYSKRPIFGGQILERKNIQVRWVPY